MTSDDIYEWTKSRKIGDVVESDIEPACEQRAVGRIVKFWGGGFCDIETGDGSEYLVSEDYMTPTGLGHLVDSQKPWKVSD